MHRRYSTTRAAGAVLYLGGCRLIAGDEVCTTDLRPAIVVEIRDARTGAPLANGARGVVRDGAYVGSLRPAESRGHDPSGLYSRAAASERPGTYAVVVEHPGYRTWTASAVRVRRRSCHVETRRLKADLQPAG